MFLLGFAVSSTGQVLGARSWLRSLLHLRRPLASSASSFVNSRIFDRTASSFVLTKRLTSLQGSIQFSRRSRICLTSRKEKPKPCIFCMKLKRATSLSVYRRNRPAVLGGFGSNELRS